MQTTIKLSELKNNPMRDFRVDPLDEESIGKLQASISEDGFWGGVSFRYSSKGEPQIASGHHRIEAARRAGIEEASLYLLSDTTDEAMIRVYARENATQRGQIGTAQAGSVAAAVRYVAKALLLGPELCPEYRTQFEQDGRSKTHLLSEEGVGERRITDFLRDIPGINKESVRQQLANLKTSGEYARIILGVYEEIEQERKEAEQALIRLQAETMSAKGEDLDRALENEERAHGKVKALRKSSEDAQRAHEAAEGQEKVFDFIGVSKHLRLQAHIEEFRDIVTSEKGEKYIDWSQQATLAEELVKAAAKDHELNYRIRLTAAYIRSNAWAMLDQFDDSQASKERKRKAEIRAKDWEEKAKVLQKDFASGIRKALGAAKRIHEHEKKRPRGSDFGYVGEFKTAIDNARTMMKLLDEIAPEPDIEAEPLRIPAA
jgi:DNA-binding HxlR family transcriptional regulator